LKFRQMMRLLYLIPAATSAGPLGPQELLRRETILQSLASSGIKVRVRDVPDAPPTIESLEDERLAISPTLQAAVQAERDGFDLVILGCFGDPGVDMIRSSVAIPVVGAAHASLHAASMLGPRLGILTVSTRVLPLISNVLRTTSLADRVISVKTIDRSVAEVRADRDEAVRRFTTAGESALREQQIDVFVLGCMSAGFQNIGPELSRNLGVPVVCPVITSLKTAERVALQEGATTRRS
jgi:allantoin racemase